MTNTEQPRRPVRQRWLMTSEVAEILHVSPKTVGRWAKEGKLPHVRTMGGHRRYPEREIRALADQLTTPVTFTLPEVGR